MQSEFPKTFAITLPFTSAFKSHWLTSDLITLITLDWSFVNR
jgi:hypothetical protein